MRWMIYLSVLATLAAVPVSAKVIEPTCADFLYSRSVGMHNMTQYDVIILQRATQILQAPDFGAARMINKEAIKLCRANPGYTFDYAVMQSIVYLVETNGGTREPRD